MMGGLTLGAALLLGFAASGHCLAMCGGISAALGVATAKRDGRPRASLLVAYQVGRMLSYAIAGGLIDHDQRSQTRMARRHHAAER